MKTKLVYAIFACVLFAQDAYTAENDGAHNLLGSKEFYEDSDQENNSPAMTSILNHFSQFFQKMSTNRYHPYNDYQYKQISDQEFVDLYEVIKYSWNDLTEYEQKNVPKFIILSFPEHARLIRKLMTTISHMAQQKSIFNK